MRGKNHLCILFGHVTSFRRRRDIHFTALCPLFLFAQRMIGLPEHGVIGNSSLVLLPRNVNVGGGEGLSRRCMFVSQRSWVAYASLMEAMETDMFHSQLSDSQSSSISINQGRVVAVTSEGGIRPKNRVTLPTPSLANLCMRVPHPLAWAEECTGFRYCALRPQQSKS